MSDHEFIDLLVRQANEKNQYIESLKAQNRDLDRYVGQLLRAK